MLEVQTAFSPAENDFAGQVIDRVSDIFELACADVQASADTRKIIRERKIDPDIGRLKRCALARGTAQPDGSRECQRAFIRCEIAIERRGLRFATLPPDPRCCSCKLACKAAVERSRPVELDADWSQIALDQRSPIDDGQVEVGQTGRLIGLGEHHGVERPEAEYAIDISAEESRSDEFDPAYGRRAETVFEIDDHFLDREVGPVGIADHEIAQPLLLRADRDDIVSRWKAQPIQLRL